MWPRAMESLIAVAAIFALDVFAEAKLPCELPDFDYYTRVLIAVAAPIIITALFVLAGVLWAMHQRRRRRKKKIALRRSAIQRASARGSQGSIFKEGLWIAAPFALNFIDIMHPTLTKTLFSFFTCRNLQAAGWWLEMDYSTSTKCGVC